MLRKPQKPPEGARLRDTADMIAWRKEFEKMKTEDHKNKLRELGLDDDDLEEFEAIEKGEKTLEEEMVTHLDLSERETKRKKKIEK